MKFYINECLKRVSDGELLDRGFILDTETQEIVWHEPITSGNAHVYGLDEVTYENGTPVSLEDGELIGEPYDEYLSRIGATSKKYICNLKDPGTDCIRTGYEDTLEGTREECMRNYLHHIRINCNMEEITEADVDMMEVDWEED